MQSAPLAGIKVYDFSQVVAGPYGSVLLAEYGADVVGVEPPQGAAQRWVLKKAPYPGVNHNKRSIAIDLKADGAEAVIERIAKDADVILHNYTPGTMERLGCGYEQLREYNDQLVYGSLTGFGEDGPYKDRRGYDPIAQALSGLMSVTGEPDRKPSRVGASLIDYATGVHLAFATLAAVMQRDRTGRGQKFECSLFDVAATFMGYWYTYYSRTGHVPERRSSSLDLNASQGIFQTADDLVFVEFADDRHWQNMTAAIGREDWREDERIATEADRNENREYLHDLVDREFKRYGSEELLSKLLDANVPAARVNTIPQAIEDPQLEHRGTVRTITDVDGKEVVIAGTPVHFSDFEPEIKSPPGLGEDTVEVLGELGFDAEETARLIEDSVTPIEDWDGQ